MGFADGKERLNVWVAFLNLECTFGTDASADQVFRRAASHNEAKQDGGFCGTLLFGNLIFLIFYYVFLGFSLRLRRCALAFGF